jgi:hypothetical protein
MGDQDTIQYRDGFLHGFGKKQKNGSIFLGILGVVEMEVRHGNVVEMADGHVHIEFILVGQDHGSTPRGVGRDLGSSWHRGGVQEGFDEEKACIVATTGGTTGTGRTTRHVFFISRNKKKYPTE